MLGILYEYRKRDSMWWQDSNPVLGTLNKLLCTYYSLFLFIRYLNYLLFEKD